MQNIVQTVLHKMGNCSEPQTKVMTRLLTTMLVLCVYIQREIYVQREILEPWGVLVTSIRDWKASRK